MSSTVELYGRTYCSLCGKELATGYNYHDNLDTLEDCNCQLSKEYKKDYQELRDKYYSTIRKIQRKLDLEALKDKYTKEKEQLEAKLEKLNKDIKSFNNGYY